MKYLFVFLLMFTCAVSYGQVEVKAGELKDHIGDSVKFCGNVTTARLMDRMKNTPIFLNIDGAYPNQVLTVVIWGDSQKNFSNKPAEFYTGKNVCIYGKVEKYREQLQIVIQSESQLQVKEHPEK
jgi:endonuclease G